MIGYIIVSHDDEVYSNKLNKSLDDAKEDVLYRSFDKYFMTDIKCGRFVSDLNDVSSEADFEVAVEGYINQAEYIIAVDMNTNDIEIYYQGILMDRRK